MCKLQGMELNKKQKTIYELECPGYLDGLKNAQNIIAGDT